MIIYNVTIYIDQSIHKEWLIWIREQIGRVLETGKFEKATFSRVLVEDNSREITYSVQYKSYSREALDTYYKESADKLRKKGQERFGEKMLTFRTELQIIDEYTVKFK